MMVAMVDTGMHVFLKFGDNNKMTHRDVLQFHLVVFVAVVFNKWSILMSKLNKQPQAKKPTATCSLSLLLHRIALIHEYKQPQGVRFVN